MKSIQLYLKNEHVIRRIKVDQIAFISIKSRYVLVHLLKQQVFTCNMTLNDFEKILPEHFLRIHRGCIVNSNKIIEFNIKSRKLILISGNVLGVSVRKVQKLIEHLDPITLNLQ